MNANESVHESSTLRDLLEEIVDEVSPSLGYSAAVKRRAAMLRRRRRTRRLLASVTTVCLLSVGGTALHIRLDELDGQDDTAAAATDGPFLSWDPTGNRARDANLLQQALRIWDNADTGPHGAVHPLLLDDENALGPVIVVEGRSRTGEPRLAFITASADNKEALSLRVDRPAPDPVTTRTISLVTPWMQSDGSLATSSWAVALSAPGADRVTITSTAVDEQEIGDNDGQGHRHQISFLPLSATALTCTVTTYWSHGTATGQPASGGTVRDVQPVAATVRETSDSSVKAQVNGANTAVAPGQFVAISDGLLGRVRSVSGGTLEIQPVTAASSVVSSRTSLSNIHGNLRGSGSGITFTDISDKDQDQVLVGNRVEVIDPAETDPRVGAITVGRISDRSSSGAGMEVQPTATVKPGSVVYVLTPPASRNG